MRVLAAYPSDHNDPPFQPPAGVDVVDCEPWFLDGVGPHLAPDPMSDPVGASEALEEWARHLGSEVIVPLTEEAVLPCGMATESLRLERGVDLLAAYWATDRRQQRCALPKELSPRWDDVSPDGLGMPVVVKAPASALSLGVRLVESEVELDAATAVLDRRYADRLDLVGLYPSYLVLYEEFVPGEQWEIGGFVVGNRLRLFRPLLHEWDRPMGVISRYVPGEAPPAALEAAIRAVRALDLRDCGFCVEVKGSGERWKVIEAHARTGEDGGDYHRLLTGGAHPATLLCRALAGY